MTERDLDLTSTFLRLALPDAVLAKLSPYDNFETLLLLIYGVFFNSGADYY